MNEVLKKFAAATNNELFDAEYRGGEWMVDHVETQETIDQFIESSAHWSERSPMKQGVLGDLPFVAWKLTQASPGKARQSMSVIDLGEVRIALPGTDLSMF